MAVLFLPRRLVAVIAGVGIAASLALISTSAASAATVINGPINLGAAAPFGVLGASAVTNTGPTLINGDLGVSPGTSITGFGAAPSGVVIGTVHQTDAVAVQAQRDTTTAYNVAASLTPTRTGLTELNGLSLTPGVYSGGALSLASTGTLTLAGTANSVWVFQAASTLTIGSGTRIITTGGASSCNVFWQVGSSATIGTGAQFQGTVLAQQSVTATTSATVVGRLLARVGAVTLDTNTITVPSGCPASGTPAQTVSPTITSGTPPTATASQPYSYTVSATGSPTPTYTATGLPAGLTLNGTTGTISGTPTTSGTSAVTITATNDTPPNATTVVRITVRPATPAPTRSATGSTTPATTTTTPTATTPSQSSGSTTPAATLGANRNHGELAYTGSDPTLPLSVAALLLAAGTVLITARRRAARHD
ncbi:ice-binding family protein [Curtobacterium sp. ISL-83]|uniref:ice-binding family protein n=1 Tax=Curtobacterium sp. ISL-83 TaxID=2819145 RepID=UPI001BE9DB90|nr:ice-binding family protein [Curtobacterium sp. ISL-83]MBT2502889.1 DUF3494 domain-containing protein [Curtobacterium sp. ISL-83]